MRLDQSGHGREVLVQRRNQGRQLELLREPRVVGDVGEQDRDLALFAAERRPLAERERAFDHRRRQIKCERAHGAAAVAIGHAEAIGEGSAESDQLGVGVEQRIENFREVRRPQGARRVGERRPPIGLLVDRDDDRRTACRLVAGPNA